ncbi:MAG: peptidylprolyl isomerase [Planctomycetes bacterium]|nr:peptidylprolyl isomerase [Planctomycetota bacterium]
MRTLVGLPLAVALGACSGAPDAATEASFEPIEPIPRSASIERGVAAPVVATTLDPSILLPRRPAVDDVVATVGEIELHESHVFERLVETNRRATRNVIDVLIMDAVIAAQAEKYGVLVDDVEIDALVAREEELLRERVRIEWGARKSFSEYVRGQFDRTVEEYREFLRVELARERYRSYVIRFLAMLEDRVEVRLLVHRDRDVVQRAADAVREGADFATLAYRHSEDETRNDGGLMPPFTRAFEHPVAKKAFTLEEGEVSDVFPMAVGNEQRWCVLYCVRRMAGQPDLKFADVRETLRQGLEERGLSPFEQKSFALRWCGDSFATAR